MMKRILPILGVLLGVSGLRAASDWPQWQGPSRTRISQETGLLKEWPASGPRVVWTATNLGAGYGSMAVVGDRVFVGSGDGKLYGVNAATGKSAFEFEAGGAISASPAVVDGRLVIGTVDGKVYCLG